MDEVKSHFPARTLFEEYWPSKGLLEALPPTAAASSAGHKRSHSRLPSSAPAAVPAWTRRQSSAETVAVMPASVMAAAASSASGAATVTAKERGSKGNGYVTHGSRLVRPAPFFCSTPFLPWNSRRLAHFLNPFSASSASATPEDRAQAAAASIAAAASASAAQVGPGASEGVRPAGAARPRLEGAFLP